MKDLCGKLKSFPVFRPMPWWSCVVLRAEHPRHSHLPWIMNESKGLNLRPLIQSRAETNNTNLSRRIATHVRKSTKRLFMHWRKVIKWPEGYVLPIAFLLAVDNYTLSNCACTKPVLHNSEDLNNSTRVFDDKITTHAIFRLEKRVLIPSASCHDQLLPNDNHNRRAPTNRRFLAFWVCCETTEVFLLNHWKQTMTENQSEHYYPISFPGKTIMVSKRWLPQATRPHKIDEEKLTSLRSRSRDFFSTRNNRRVFAKSWER